MPFRFLPAVLLSAGWAAGQVPQIAKPHNYGRMQSADTVSYSYSDPSILFSQSLGATHVVSNHAGGASFVNPALLGEPNARWANGLATWRYSSLFPVLNLPDLWQSHGEAIHQGFGMGLSLKWESHHFGAFATDTSSTVENHGFSGNTYALSAGRRLGGTKRVAHFLGGTASWVSAPSEFAAKRLRSHGFLLDIGYLGVFAKTFRVGISAQNLGMPLQGIKPMLIEERYGPGTRTYRKLMEEEDFLLTPPQLHGGAGLRHEWNGASLRILETVVSSAYTLEFQKAGFRDPRQFQTYELNWLLLNTLQTEYGFLIPDDQPLLKWGFGFNLFNHLLINYTQLQAPGYVWDGQKAVVLGLHNLLAWKKSDWTWWRK